MRIKTFIQNLWVRFFWVTLYKKNIYVIHIFTNKMQPYTKHTNLDRLDRNKHTYEIKGENVIQNKGRSFRYSMTLQYII